MRAGRSRLLRIASSIVTAGLVAAWATGAISFVADSGASLPRHARHNHDRNADAVTARRAVVDDTKVEKPRVHNEWRMNVGRAIDVLRRDIVDLFSEDNGLQNMDFSIYEQDIEFADARAPNFRLHGLDTYKQVLATLRTALRTTCQRIKLEIRSVQPPVNNEVRFRWQLRLTPVDVFAPAKGLLASMRLPLGRQYMTQMSGLGPLGHPLIFEGYSTYEFDAWSGKIVKHTIDITNPPLYITDLLQGYVFQTRWVPTMSGPRVPQMWPQAANRPLAASATTEQVPALAGSGTTTGSTAARGTSPGTAQNGAPTRDATSKVSRQAFPDWMGFIDSCEDDFECNDGKANFPLQCCELPVLGKFCCEPDNFVPVQARPSYVPMPVPVEEPGLPRKSPEP